MTSTRESSIEARSGWTGWVYFAAILMIVGGALHAIAGSVAVFNDDWVVFGADAAVLLDLTGWGWLQIALGALIILSAILLMRGSTVGRTAAVVLASLSIWANFLWLPVYPAWGIIVITIMVLILYAVIVHGRELKQ